VPGLLAACTPPVLPRESIAATGRPVGDLELLRERGDVTRGASHSLLRGFVDEVDNHDLVVVLDLELAVQSRGARRWPVELLPRTIDPSCIERTRQWVTSSLAVGRA
jgi:hypothetical protein